MLSNNGQMPNNFRFTMFPAVLRWLIGANVGIFLLSYLMKYQPALAGLNEIFHYFGALWPVDSGRFFPSQYVSYIFMHAGVPHLFFNMLALWMFGMELANIWGTRRFLSYYLLCGIGAGVVHSIVTYFMGDGAPTVGASGAVMGIMVAFALLFPKRIVVIFPFPPMPAKYAAMVFTAVDLYLGVSQSGDGVAHFAHLGGAVVGFLLLWISRRRMLGGGAQRPAAPDPAVVPMPARVIDMPIMDGRNRETETSSTKRHALPILEFGDDQALIDALLDKASREGYHRLTDEEKELLIEASKRIR